MAQGKTNLIDGFAAVQAVRRAQTKHGGARKDSAQTPKPADKTPPKQSPAALPVKRVGHTAMPTRRSIICYECGYGHTVAGALHNSFCPKCRKKLETGDKVIEGNWDSDVKTIGNVSILPGSIVKTASVYGNNISIAGDVRQAELHATSGIEILSGAKLDVTHLKTVKLHIPAENCIKLSQQLTCRKLEIDGELHADIMAEEIVKITAGGLLKGKVSCPSLIVESGAGLVADVELRPKQGERQ